MNEKQAVDKLTKLDSSTKSTRVIVSPVKDKNGIMGGATYPSWDSFEQLLDAVKHKEVDKEALVCLLNYGTKFWFKVRARSLLKSDPDRFVRRAPHVIPAFVKKTT